MKRKIVITLLAFALSFSTTGCITIEKDTDKKVEKNQNEEPKSDIQEQSDDYATVENPADIREKHSLKGTWGTFSVKLDNAYVGEEVTNKLTEIGEDADLANGLIEGEEGFKTVLFEYTISADKGFKEEPFNGYEILGNDFWDVEHKSTYEYYSTDLMKNANLDVINIVLNAGEESKAYALFAFPNDANTLVNCIDCEDGEYWFKYTL